MCYYNNMFLIMRSCWKSNCSWFIHIMRGRSSACSYIGGVTSTVMLPWMPPNSFVDKLNVIFFLFTSGTIY